MMNFVASFLNVPLEEAISMRSKALPSYGTTLEWLMTEHMLINQDEYFAAVHPETELNELQKDPLLREYLLSLNLPMTLLTNAPMSHALRVLEFFNIQDIFLGVFDLTYHKGVGKPHPESFRSTLAAVGFSVNESLFVDDLPKYVRGYMNLGGQAVLVDETGKNKSLAQTEGFGYIRSIYELKAFLTNS